jgi:hypothetical protein
MRACGTGAPRPSDEILVQIGRQMRRQAPAVLGFVPHEFTISVAIPTRATTVTVADPLSPCASCRQLPRQALTSAAIFDHLANHAPIGELCAHGRTPDEPPGQFAISMRTPRPIAELRSNLFDLCHLLRICRVLVSVHSLVSFRASNDRMLAKPVVHYHELCCLENRTFVPPDVTTGGLESRKCGIFS